MEPERDTVSPASLLHGHRARSVVHRGFPDLRLGRGRPRDRQHPRCRASALPRRRELFPYIRQYRKPECLISGFQVLRLASLSSEEEGGASLRDGLIAGERVSPASVMESLTWPLPFRKSPCRPRATFPSTSWCSASPTSGASRPGSRSRNWPSLSPVAA
ncbi:hypothetical protein AGR1B_Lc50015 [Agrobacterium fabacearum S56]|nr:hypothetical protein AGR1B_Lc50015 [Agrobacterium fabacearum S56]